MNWGFVEPRAFTPWVASIAALNAFLLLSQQPPAEPYSRTVTQNGTSVTVKVKHLDSQKTAADPLREFENVTVQVQFADAVSRSPLTGGSPAAWIDQRPGADRTTPAQCVGKVKRFAEGSTFSHTQLDLTSYFVVTMNNDATLTVVDPRFGYGDTRLLALVPLDGVGEDWAATTDGNRLFVSEPSANEVAAIDTASWKPIGAAKSVPNAARIALQPDEAYVWAAYSGEKEDSGVSVLSTHDLRVAARIRTGQGYHHVTFTEDSSFAFVTNPQDGTVSVIDIRKLSKVADIQVGTGPKWITYSSLAKAAYVANEGDGSVVAIDGSQHSIRARINAAPGLGQIRFAPAGRFALVVNPSTDMIYVIDAASNRIVQQAKLDKGPDQIAFTNKTAHIRQRGNDAVLMIPLASLGQANTPLAPGDFSGGKHPPGEISRPTPADGIVQASGENGVLVANAGDKSVYLYMEGAAAPMGTLSNYGREPRAVLSLDRNLRERSPGSYETSTTLPAAGSYDLALFFNQPRIVSCFELEIASDPTLGRPKLPKLKVEQRLAASTLVGEAAHVAFRLTFADTGRPDTDAKDVVILVAGAEWQHREIAPHRGDGVYSVDFRVPRRGIYDVFLSAQSQGLIPARYGRLSVGNAPN